MISTKIVTWEKMYAVAKRMARQSAKQRARGRAGEVIKAVVKTVGNAVIHFFKLELKSIRQTVVAQSASECAADANGTQHAQRKVVGKG